MDALILDGGLEGGSRLAHVRETLRGELSAHGHTVRTVELRQAPIACCLGCFDCWVRTPGVCRTRDAGPDVARALIASDAVFFLTPVTFGGYSSELKKALDRIVGLVSPFFTRIDGEVHHRKRYRRYPRLVVIGTLEEPCPEEEATFHALARRNALNMHTPWHASRVFHGMQQEAEVDRSIRLTLTELERST